jgi:small-conductance mechanosensitive channel
MGAIEQLIESILKGVEQIIVKVVSLGPTIVYVLIALVVAFFVIKLIQFFVKRFFLKIELNEDIEYLITRAVGWVLWFLVIMWLVGQLGLENVFESLLAVGALGGLAVALAVKDSLKDVVSGVLVLQDRHFDLGDKVSTAGVKGTIVEVGLRKTRIVKEDGSIAVVPNAKIDSSGWELIERKGKQGKEFVKEKEIKDYIEKTPIKKIKKLVKK